MEKGRKVSHIEGVANHDGRESCVGVCKGVRRSVDSGGAGGAIEPRNEQTGVPTRSKDAEGNTAAGAIASRRRTPRGHRTQARTEISMRENREAR